MKALAVDPFSLRKRFVHVADARVAYYEEGVGEPVVLLHGCPFSSFIWRKVIPLLSDDYRCLAPDLLGLGDTETPPDADWSLPAQARVLVGILNALGLDRVHLVGHDHGGAVAQMLAAHHPDRLATLTLSNAEAYDNWPSPAERPLARLPQIPVLGSLAAWLASRRAVARLTLGLGRAVKDVEVLDSELLDGYIRANTGDPHRRAKWRRFIAGQFDSANQHHTVEVLDRLRRFDRPTLLLWGADDPHFGPEWAQRLQSDIPGAAAPILISGAGHLVMEERPEEFAAHLRAFLADQAEDSTQAAAAPASTAVPDDQG